MADEIYALFTEAGLDRSPSLPAITEDELWDLLADEAAHDRFLDALEAPAR